MPTSIDDKIITDSLYLNRFDAQQRKEVEALLKQMKRELLAILSEKYLLEATKRQVQALINETDAVIDKYYNQAATQLDIESLFMHVVGTAQAAVQAAIPITIAAGLPTVGHMKSIMSSVMFDGSPLAAWWDKQGQDVKFKMGGIIRQGIVQGSDYGKLVGPVMDLLDMKNKRGAVENARGLIHTSIQTVANDARMAVFEANADVIRCLVWVATLDSHVCPLCIGRSGKKWKVDRTPIGHKIPFQLPPIHVKDRCIISGQSIYTPKESTPGFERASSIGPVDAKITFDEYLKRVPPAQVEEMLGKGRYQLWKDGKITTLQLLDQTGRELTLKQLTEKYG